MKLISNLFVYVLTYTKAYLILTFQLKEEMLSAYQQLKALCLQLHRGVENNNKAAIQSESDFIHSCIEVGII